MENIVTANELKTKDIARIDEITSNGDEAIISVRGELEAALVETHRDLERGDTVQETVEDHMQRITSA